MDRSLCRVLAWLCLVCVPVAYPCPVRAESNVEFQLRFDKSVSDQPFSGRVYVMLSKKQVKQLPSGPRWLNTEPFFAMDVKSWRPGTTLTMSSAETLGYPYPLSELPEGKYWAYAVMDFDPGQRSFIKADGNGYSKPMQLKVSDKQEDVTLSIDQVYRSPPFKETERVKLVRIKSNYLSAFHKRPVHMNAGVVLPKSFAENPEKKYPVIYAIPGFSGTHRRAFGAALRNPTDVAGVEMLYVVLDPSCKWGHSVFADSANNGPWGKALVEELIPAIESRFRASGTPSARFVRGHSSGGWSSLWLQVTYPDFFGGTWSTAPDPVDFRDFQRVNIYAKDVNLFYDAKGKSRPLVRKGGKVVMHYKPFSDMEAVMGHGGQLGSFEAVFSPKGPDGLPSKLWNRETGKIDPEVAEHWKRYDIRLVLEENWDTLGPKLAGKLHIYMGTEDNFYLEGATIHLKQSLQALGSDAVVELFPGKDHGSVMTAELRNRIEQQMAKQFLSNRSQDGKEQQRRSSDSTD